MSTSRVPAVRLGDGQTRITVAIAAATWLGAWFVGNLAGAAMMTLLGRDSNDSQVSVAATVAAALALWIPILVALGLVSVRFGLSSWRADYGLAFRSIDLVGVPVGVLTQLVLLRIVYWPLQAIWPDTFSAPHLEETARDLYDSAHGAWLVALVLLVVVGAPFVEELLYRGLLQGAFVRRVNEVLAVVIVAIWFAFIHFRPIEYPGLLVIGLVLGTCALVTRRLGMGIMAHAAFNATGLIWVATR